MKLSELNLNPLLYEVLSKNIEILRPSQEKAVKSGLLERKNLLVCTPTASGKTLIAELAMLQGIYNKIGKAVYIVPLKALATEKYNEFKEKYKNIKVGLSIGDIDSADNFLDNYDLIVTVSEKLDSLIRHKANFINRLATIIIDEIHLLNDATRGPTLEVVITILKNLLKNAQFIGLSATIGNPNELADWLNANLVIDDWRPIELKKGIYFNGKIDYY
ncbi:MAG: DEAD/DEAH box helicase [Candidatus Woesearchaeota archaeon]